MEKYAAVVVNRKAAALDRVFHYGIPASMFVACGMIVEVPLGRQKLEGVVVDVTDQVDCEPAKIKNILFWQITKKTCKSKPWLRSTTSASWQHYCLVLVF